MEDVVYLSGLCVAESGPNRLAAPGKILLKQLLQDYWERRDYLHCVLKRIICVSFNKPTDIQVHMI